MSATKKSLLFTVLFGSISGPLMRPLWGLGQGGWWNELLFIIGALFGGAAVFCSICFTILVLSGYEHSAERARVRELNRHAGQWNALLSEQMGLYSRTKGVHTPETDAEWRAMNHKLRKEESRHKQVNGPIMAKHARLELLRFLIFVALFSALCIAVAILSFWVPS